MKLVVDDLRALDLLIKSTIQIVPSALFSVGPEGIEIDCISESGTARAFFKSECMKAKELVTFALSDLTKLKNTLTLINKTEQLDTVTFNLGKAFFRRIFLWQVC